MKFLKLLLAITFLLFLISCQQQKDKSPSPLNNTLVILVRHAEKATDDTDSPLTEEGLKRALALQTVLEHAKINAIYSSQFKRNLDTVKPLAEHISVAITTIPVDLNNPQPFSEAFVKKIKEKHLGETILIVSHSNTIPLMIDLFLEKKAEIKKIEYSDFFLVSIPSKGSSSLIKTQYGK